MRLRHDLPLYSYKIKISWLKDGERGNLHTGKGYLVSSKQNELVYQILQKKLYHLLLKSPNPKGEVSVSK